MSNITFDYMETYIKNLIPERTGMLKEVEEYAREHKVPIVQKETGKFLELMVTMKRPLRILELGTAVGYSAILMYNAANTNPDIVTMDITMPIKDGIDAVKDIIELDPTAKVIMVTAAGQKSNMVEALKRGAADFIQKPFESEVILNTIEKVLEDE